MPEAEVLELTDPACRPGLFARAAMMMRVLPTVLWAFPCVLVVVPALPAQAESRDALSIDELRTAEFLNAPRRKALEEWVQKQANVLISENVDMDDKRRIRRVFSDVVNKKPAPTEDFKRKFADAIVRVFDPYLKDGEVTGALVMVYILYDLRELRPESMLRDAGLRTALSHPNPAVKYWAARTIRLLHASFADLAGLRESVIESLRAAGMAETNGSALREIYLALDFSKTIGKVPFADEVVKALVGIVAVRGERYALGEVPVSDGDVAGLSAMSRLSGPTNDARADVWKRYLTALGRMLCRVADDYIAELGVETDLTAERRSRIRQLMQVCRQVENELGRVVKAADLQTGNLPSVLEAMRNGDKNQIIAERNRWCGWPPGTQGILNDKALGIPLGAGYVELKKKGGGSGAR